MAQIMVLWDHMPTGVANGDAILAELGIACQEGVQNLHTLLLRLWREGVIVLVADVVEAVMHVALNFVYTHRGLSRASIKAFSVRKLIKTRASAALHPSKG
jgi:hypothetical protein